MGALEQGRGSNSAPERSARDHPAHAAMAQGLWPPVDAAVLTSVITCALRLLSRDCS